MGTQQKTDEDKIKEWKQKLKDDWDYRRKLVVFEGENGMFTPTTTTTTTTTTTPKPLSTSTTPPGPNNATTTSNLTTLSGIVVTITTAVAPVDPEKGELKTAGSETLIRTIGITCGALVALLMVAVLFIMVCRRKAAKSRQRISVRRPLNPAEEVDHIYAEIEPLQAVIRDTAAGSPGAVGGSVPLPSRKEKKSRKGMSSFRKISTRIYRLFGQDTEEESQAVSYSKSAGMSPVQEEAPEPPRRNIVNGRHAGRRQKRTGRLPSGSKPLLEGGSSFSSGSVEMRDPVYNPLIRAGPEERVSGPYDRLRLSRMQSGQLQDTGPPPESPHDYFVLEKDGAGAGPFPSGANAVSDSLETENEDGLGDLVEEAGDSPTPKNHDYFILEPQPGVVAPGSPVTESDNDQKPQVTTDMAEKPEDTAKDASASPQRTTDTGAVSESRANSPGSGKDSPRKTKVKPAVQPRAIKTSNPSSPVRENTNDSKDSSIGNGSAGKDSVTSSPTEDEELYVINESKGDDYVISKMGAAPAPPPESTEEDDYLKPLDGNAVKNYMEVFPAPPPRSTSLPVTGKGNLHVNLEDNAVKTSHESAV